MENLYYSFIHSHLHLKESGKIFSENQGRLRKYEVDILVPEVPNGWQLNDNIHFGSVTIYIPPTESLLKQYQTIYISGMLAAERIQLIIDVDKFSL